MSKKKKTPVSSYGPDWNAKVVDRPKKQGVYINGQKVSDNAADQSKYDARSAEQIRLADQVKIQTPKIQTVPTPKVEVPSVQQLRDAGISSIGGQTHKDTFIKDIFSRIIGGSKAKVSDATTAQNQSRIKETPAGIGIGYYPTQRVATPSSTTLKKANEGVGAGYSPTEGKTPGKLSPAETLAAFGTMADNADFRANTQATNGQLNSVYLGPRYRYINDLSGMKQLTNGTGNSAFDMVVNAMPGPDVAMQRQGVGQLYANPYRLYDQMTSDEVSMLNYLVKTRGEASAEQYLKALESTLKDRQLTETDKVTAGLEKTPVLGSIMSVPLNAASAMEGAMTLIAGGKGLSENDTYRGATRMATQIRDSVSGKMTPVGGFFYQTGMSMLDTAFRLPFGNGGLAIAGLSAASQTAEQAIGDGASTEQALWLAGISGSLEVVTEKVSLDNLFKARMAGNLKQIIKSALLQGGIEASEEAASEIGNIIADTLIRKDDSDWSRRVNLYRQNGYAQNEAIQKTLLDKSVQVGVASLGGFTSGIFFGAGAQIATNIAIGQEQGKKGFDALKVGSQIVEKLNRAKEAYKNAMKTTPRYTAQERVAIARDIEASGMDDESKTFVSHLVDSFAAQPDGWLTDKGQELTQSAIELTRKAAARNYVAGTNMQAKRTRALGRLNSLFSDVQSAYTETQGALEQGDLQAHANAIDKTNTAIEKYEAAYQNEQAENQARNAKQEVEVQDTTVEIMDVAKQLESQIPTEIWHQTELAIDRSRKANEEYLQFLKDWQKKEQDRQQAENEAIPLDLEASRNEAVPLARENSPFESKTDEKAPDNTKAKIDRDIADILERSRQERQALDELKQKRIKEEEEKQAFVDRLTEIEKETDPKKGEYFSRLDPEYEARAKLRYEKMVKANGPMEKNIYSIYQTLALTDENIETTAMLYEDSMISHFVDGIKTYGEWLNSEIRPFARNASEKFGFASKIAVPKEGMPDVRSAGVVRKHERAQRAFRRFMSDELNTDETGEKKSLGEWLAWVEDPDAEPLTTPETTDTVDTDQEAQNAQEPAQEPAPIDITKRMMDSLYGTPQTAQPAKKGGTFNLIGFMMNGGKNGKQGNASMAGQAIPRFQQSQADNGSGRTSYAESDAQATGRNGGSTGYSGSDRSAARGGQVSPGAGWNEKSLGDLKQAAASINEDLARAGSAPLKDGDLKPVDNLDEESAYWLKRMESLSGRKALVYTSESGRTDIKNGFANNNREYVRYQPGKIMTFHFAHEIAENNSTIRKAGFGVLDAIGPQSFENYLKIKGAEAADEETKRGLRKEFVCDAYGAVMFQVATQGKVNDQIGISDEDYKEFQNAFADHLAAPAISEETLDKETRTNAKLGGSRYSSTAVIDPSMDTWAAEAFQLYNDGVTYESYMNRENADWRVGKQLYGLWNGIRKIRVMQRALDLFENNVTPEQYWQKNKTHFGKTGDQDFQVLTQLHGMYLRNNVPVGGRLGEGENGELETIMKNIGQAMQYHEGRLTISAPARVFENLGAFRKESSIANIAANYQDGERLRGTYFDYLMNQNASRAAYMETWRNNIAKAYGSGGVRESNLAQLLGEKIITPENAREAVYDGQHMLVRAIDGWFVFKHSGELLAFCDGDTTFFRDPKANAKTQAENAETDVKKTAVQKARERLRTEFTQVDKSTIRVERKGNNAVIWIPGIRNPVQIQNGKAPDAETAIRTADALTEYYAQAWEHQSRVLVENGYRPANYIPDYFPHMWQQETGLNAIIEQFVGYEPPTTIAGITSAFKPGKPWAAHLLERTGPLTEFDAIRGFNSYVQKASDVIFTTPAIQRLRQFEGYLRENAGVKFEEKTNSTLADWLRKYTNGIANKAAEFDRSAESLFGREAFSLSNTASQLISRSAVQGNLSSALSQMISYASALPTLDAKSVLKGTGAAIPQAMLAMMDSDKYDGFADKIPFLKSRFGAYENILEKTSQKAGRFVDNGLGWLFTAMDRFSTEAVARAKFDELRSKGRTEQQAADETSVYCVKLFADRSKGMAPVLFNNKTLKPFLQFQNEVLNQMSHFRDIGRQSATEETFDLLMNPERAAQREKMGLNENMVEQLLNGPEDALTRDARKLQQKIAASGNAKKWIRALMYLVYLSLWSEFTRMLTGRDQTWNAYGMTKDFVQDIQGDGIPTALLNAGTNALEQLPFSSVATGGRVPIGAGIDKLATVAEDAYKGVSEGNWNGIGQSALMAALAFIPGGGQGRKTISGIQSVNESGYYTKNGELRYPVKKDDLLQVATFGPSAVAPEGYDWTDTMSVSKTGQYKELVDAGYDPIEVYDLLRNSGSTNATKGLSILTADSDGDGKPDFTGAEVNVVARVMGLTYDPKKDGSLEQWSRKAAADYEKKATKDGAPTPGQQKTIDVIQLMMQKLYGN